MASEAVMAETPTLRRPANERGDLLPGRSRRGAGHTCSTAPPRHQLGTDASMTRRSRRSCRVHRRATSGWTSAGRHGLSRPTPRPLQGRDPCRTLAAAAPRSWPQAPRDDAAVLHPDAQLPEMPRAQGKPTGQFRDSNGTAVAAPRRAPHPRDIERPQVAFFLHAPGLTIAGPVGNREAAHAASGPWRSRNAEPDITR